LNINEFLKPSIPKILVTLVLPAVVYVFLTFSLEGVLDFYWYLLTPYYRVYADVLYREFNWFTLLWVPFYLSACLMEAGYKRGMRD